VKKFARMCVRQACDLAGGQSSWRGSRRVEGVALVPAGAAREPGDVEVDGLHA
jgi:hypothetical protein